MAPEPFLNAVLEGITLQHAGELLFPHLAPSLPDLRYPKTLEKCLGDFVFCYLCTNSALVTDRLPSVGSEQKKPGEAILMRFRDFFHPLGKPTDLPETLLNDPDSRKVIRGKLLFFGKAVDDSFDYFREWIQREAATSFGSDISVYDDNARDYFYGKRPPYMYDPELQTVINDDTINRLADTVLTTLKTDPRYATRTPTFRAAREFVSRSALTHYVIGYWYESVFSKLIEPQPVLLPHTTRAELAKAAIHEISEASMPYVLAEVVMESRGSNPIGSFLNCLGQLRQITRYQRMQGLFAQLLELPRSKQEKRVRLILNQIDQLRTEAKLPTETLIYGKATRFKVASLEALRGIIIPNTYDRDTYNKAIFDVFPALNPKAASGKTFGTFVLNDSTAVIGADYIGGSVTILHHTGKRPEERKAPMSQVMWKVKSRKDASQTADVPVDQIMIEVAATEGEVRQRIESAADPGSSQNLFQNAL